MSSWGGAQKSGREILCRSGNWATSSSPTRQDAGFRKLAAFLGQHGRDLRPGDRPRIKDVRGFRL